MKFIKSISTSIFTLLLCTACESDLEQVTYSSENAIPSTLSSLNDSYILESKNASQEAFTLTWSYPQALSMRWKWMLKTKILPIK